MPLYGLRQFVERAAASLWHTVPLKSSCSSCRRGSLREWPKNRSRFLSVIFDNGLACRYARSFSTCIPFTPYEGVAKRVNSMNFALGQLVSSFVSRCQSISGRAKRSNVARTIGTPYSTCKTPWLSSTELASGTTCLFLVLPSTTSDAALDRVKWGARLYSPTFTIASARHRHEPSRSAAHTV